MKPETLPAGRQVSIIIVTYNSEGEIESCLQSIIKHVKSDFEVIIVDNASRDKTVELILEYQRVKRSKIKIIKNNENVGFGSGCNIGMKNAKGDYFLILNPDTRMENDAVTTQVKYLQDHPEAGIVGAKIVNDEGKISASGGFSPTLLRIINWMLFIDDIPIFNKFLRSYHPRFFYFDKKKELDWVTGAFFLLRREVVEKVGDFDPNFFLYVEEVEYCYRAKKAGFRVIFNPQTEIIHKGQASSKGSKKASTLGEYRGIIYFYQKHNKKLLPLVKLLLKIGAVLRMLIFGILGRKQSFANYREAYAVV